MLIFTLLWCCSVAIFQSILCKPTWHRENCIKKQEKKISTEKLIFQNIWLCINWNVLKCIFNVSALLSLLIERKVYHKLTIYYTSVYKRNGISCFLCVFVVYHLVVYVYFMLIVFIYVGDNVFADGYDFGLV